jgi:hypothetical protein
VVKTSREREGGLADLVDIAGAGDELAVAGMLGQEGGRRKAFAELAILALQVPVVVPFPVTSRGRFHQA